MDWKLGGLAAALYLAGNVAAAQEAPNVKGIRLGMTEAQVQAANPKTTCEPEGSFAGGRTCWIRGGYGPDPSGLTMVSLVDDKVYMVEAIFDHDHFAAVAAGMQQKFGLPTGTKDDQLTTRMGVTVPSKVMLWSAGERSALSLSERKGRIDRSQVRLASAEDLKRANERRKASPQNAENL